jgi:hypothetical protein
MFNQAEDYYPLDKPVIQVKINALFEGFVSKLAAPTGGMVPLVSLAHGVKKLVVIFHKTQRQHILLCKK